MNERKETKIERKTIKTTIEIGAEKKDDKKKEEWKYEKEIRRNESWGSIRKRRRR